MATTTFNKTELAAIAADVAPLLEPARLLYRADFNTMKLAPITGTWGTGGLQDVVGSPLDALWGGRMRLLSLTDPLVVTDATIEQVIKHEIRPGEGRNGTAALKQTIFKSVNGTAPMGGAATQAAVYFLPQRENPTLYVSLWLKFQPDLVDAMAAAQSDAYAYVWREVTCIKTGTQFSGGASNDGDYRIELAINAMKGKPPYWALVGDNNAGGSAPLMKASAFTLYNLEVPVPAGWFHLEQFWRRSSGPDGRVAIAVNGTTLFDRAGPNIGALNMPINRVFMPVLYSSSRLPISQWLDSIELWDSPPASASISA